MRRSAAPTFRQLDNGNGLSRNAFSRAHLLSIKPYVRLHVNSRAQIRSTAEVLELLTKKPDHVSKEDCNEELSNPTDEPCVDANEKINSECAEAHLNTNSACADTHLSTGIEESGASSDRYPIPSQPISMENSALSTTNTMTGEIKEDIGEKTPSSGDLLIYTVVYGKQTTKKHKTYEFDGTIEVRNKTIVLKDEEGKIIGRSTLKSEGIEEGTQLSIFGKAIEVVELVSAPKNSSKRSAELAENFPPSKKIK